MTFLGRLRSRQMTAARVLTALFACAWLALAVQPCAAMEGHGDQAPGTHHSGAAQEGHDCPHCPPSPQPVGEVPCGNALSCDAIGVPTMPSKAIDALQPDPFAWLPSPAAQVVAATDAAVFLGPPVPPPRRTSSASLQQRYCSFLK